VPDEFGRLTLAEIQAYVLRNLVSYQPSNVDPTTGLETGPVLLGTNQQFSEQALALRINSSITKISMLISGNNESILGKEIYYDVVPSVNNTGQLGITRYAVPPDCVQIRGLWWLRPGQTPANTPSNLPFSSDENYVPMSMQDTFDDGAAISGVNVSRPTWREVGNHIVLNQDPGDWTQVIVKQGIKLRYTRRMTYLVNATDVIEMPFANEAQECVVWDTTLDFLRTQEEVIDASGVEKTLAYWLSQLEILVRNRYRPPEIRFKGPPIVHSNWSGHPGGSRWGRGWR